MKLGGFELTFDPKADCFLAVDHNKLAYKNFISGGGNPEKAFLLRLEPPSVFPAQYRKSVENKYGSIFTPGSILQNSGNFYGWPYQIHADPTIPTAYRNGIEHILAHSQFDYRDWSQRELFLTMIAANKVAPSTDENYGLRRKFARDLDFSDFHLYGALWNESMRLKLRHRLAVTYFAIRQGTLPNLASVYGNLFFKYPRSLGFVSDKHEVLKNSKFSLVIENSDTYVSEKLFDSIINGCIPVYFGPKLSVVGLPDDVAIQYDGPDSKISQYLEEISEVDIQYRLHAMSQFLNSKDFKECWLENRVYEKIAREIFDKMLGA